MSHATLRDRIEQLESTEGAGTELVTVTVPAGDSLATIRQRVAREHASAENIRSKRIRTRVRQALKRVQRLLRPYEETPRCGLAVCAGVVDDEMVSAVFDDLPEPITERTYRCDDRFHLDPVRATVAPGETFGLVVVERGRAAVGRLLGDRVVPDRTFESQVMGSSRAGGQSAKRFERERARQAHEFFEEVAATAREAFLGDTTGDSEDREPVTGVVVGGSMGTAGQFVDGDYLDHRLRDRLLGTYGVEYATEQGLHDLVDAAEDELLDAEQRAVRERVEDFFGRLRDDDPVAYGVADVLQAAEYGGVDTALVSTEMSGDTREQIETAVAEQGGETIVVTDGSDRGARFGETFGVGALLRFPVN
jgi:peptide chain release factor subunit 1